MPFLGIHKYKFLCSIGNDNIFVFREWRVESLLISGRVKRGYVRGVIYRSTYLIYKSSILNSKVILADLWMGPSVLQIYSN